MRAIRPAGGTSRWFGLAALVLTAGALIPAALALACNPQAYLTLDKAQYAPGETVRVSGSFFKNNVDIKVSVDRTGQSTTVRTSGNGAFTATFALPATRRLGAYGVEAIGFEPDGTVTPGLPAPGSFTVAAPPTPPQTSTGGGQQSTSAVRRGRRRTRNAGSSAGGPAGLAADGTPQHEQRVELGVPRAARDRRAQRAAQHHGPHDLAADQHRRRCRPARTARARTSVDGPSSVARSLRP